MKKLFLAVATALLLATSAAHAVEWQCGPHYVSTSVLHGWPGEEKARQCRDYHILAYPSYNRTRKEALKANPHGGSDDEIGLPTKGFRWGLLPHPEFKGQCGLLYRGKPCVEYKAESEQPLTDEEKWREKDRKAEEFWRQWQADKANAQNQSETANPAWLERYHRLKEECVQWGIPGPIAGCLLEKDKEYGKELDQAYRKALALAGTNKALLRESQRSWHKYQESTCKLYEVLATSEGEGVARLSLGGCLLPLTLQRLEELRWMADCFNGRCAD